MKMQSLCIASLIGLMASQCQAATHGFLDRIVNNSPYQIKIQTTDGSGSITLKNGQTVTGDDLANKPFYLSDIKSMNLTIPWENWDGSARIYIDALKQGPFNPKTKKNAEILVKRNELMERYGNVELWTQSTYDDSKQTKAHTECRTFDTFYTIQIDQGGQAHIDFKRVDKAPNDVDWCDARWSEVKAPSVYVGTCWPGSLLKQKDACADWCGGSFNNVEQWTCSQNKMYCICKAGIKPGSHNIFNKIADTATTVGELAYNKVLKPAGDNIKKYGDAAAKVAGKIIKNGWDRLIYGRPHHNYCTFSTTDLPNPPTITSKEAKDADTDGLLPYIEKYAPVAWLEPSEDYYPTTFSEYIMAPTTSMIDQGADDAVIIPAGQITMEKLYKMYVESLKNPKKFHLGGDVDQSWSHALKIGDCTTWGANPNKYTDKDGNLTTPIYAIAFEQGDNIYIQYLFFYGFNGPYDVLFLKGDIIPDQDAHEGDLEHMTMELDKKTKELKRIYYSSHGTKEGFWLDANNPDVEYEGTHPVAYVAHYSHAIYPRDGTYVRIWGIGNDITGQGQKWYPQVMRLYPNTDKRFDYKTMGFMYYPGYQGVRGVGAVANQGWFMNPKGGDIGRDYGSTKRFCSNPPHRSGIEELAKGVDLAIYEECVLEKIPSAKAPE